MYYKYRSTENLQFALDVLVQRRLYASEFTKLNDPMEGMFTYDRSLPNWISDAIYDRKLSVRILSLCESPSNLLMWSYYSAGHKGFVVGGEIEEPGIAAISVKYVSNFNLESIERSDLAEEILSKKHVAWSHEREHRVFVPSSREPFVTFRFKELIFGIETPKPMMELLSAIAKRFNPGIEIWQIDREKLDVGAGRVEA